MDARNVGERITYFREKSGMTKNKLASKAGVSPTYIYQVENGEKCPTVEYMDYICFGLGMTLADFFTEESEPSSLDDELLRKVRELSPDEKQALLTLLNRK